MLFAGLQSVRMVKNCDLGFENAALGLRPRTAFLRPRSQFFTIRSSQPAKNICTYVLFKTTDGLLEKRQEKEENHSVKELIKCNA